MKKVLITGISGFAGSFLAEYIVSLGTSSVVGTTITDPSPNLSAIREQIQLEEVNLMDSSAVRTLIAEIKPDVIYHLAALAAPAESFTNPAATMTNNITAQVNLFEAVRLAGIENVKILVTSSADIYGRIAPEDLPVDEDTPFMPTNPYAVSKIAQDFLALQYYLSYRMHTIRARPSNHIGPRQTPAAIVAKFAKQIAEVEKGVIPPVIHVGNLDTKRDFTDVRDMVRAYVALIEKGISGEAYNIGSGISYKMSDILEMLLSQSSREIAVETDASLFRPADNPEFVCNAAKMTSVTGWKPEKTIESTLRDTLDYWRKIV